MARTKLSLTLPSLLLGLPMLACSSPATNDEDSGTSDASSDTTTATTDATESESGLPETETGTETETSDTDGDPPRPARLVVTADWRAKRLSLLDYAALRDGATTRDAALWKTIELPDHEPGPIEVELTPDGSLALVAVGPGFFGGQAGALVGLAAGQVPSGGGLLIVDIETGVVLADLDTAQHPLGIAISPDGATAWTANYGGDGQSGSTISEIDVNRGTITAEYDVGPNPEQLDLSADGSLALFNTAGDGSVRLFDPSDPAGTLSAPLFVSNDPSWVLILEDGMDRAVAINSVGPPGYSLIDIGDPMVPVLIETIEVAGIPYAAAPGRTSSEILLSMYAGASTRLQMFDVDTSAVIDEIEVPRAIGFPLGIVFDPDDELALVPAPGANALIVADLTTDEYRVIDWQTEVGPTYVTLEAK